MNKKQACSVLGVDFSFTKDEIKTKYRSLAKQFHPGNKKTGDENTFKEITKAYDICMSSIEKDCFHPDVNYDEDYSSKYTDDEYNYSRYGNDSKKYSVHTGKHFHRASGPSIEYNEEHDMWRKIFNF